MVLCCYLTGTIACLTPAKYLTRRLLTAVLAFLVAAFISAPQWLIFVRTLSQSLTAYDAPAARFATWPFAVSLVFGLMKPGGLLPAANPPIAAFGLAALLVGVGTWRSGAKRAAVLGPAITLAIAFGAVPERVIISLPFFANIHQIDYTFMGATIVLLCIAGGIGVAGLIDTTRAAIVSVAASAHHWLRSGRCVAAVESRLFHASPVRGILGAPVRGCARNPPRAGCPNCGNDVAVAGSHRDGGCDRAAARRAQHRACSIGRDTARRRRGPAAWTDTARHTLSRGERHSRGRAKVRLVSLACTRCCSLGRSRSMGWKALAALTRSNFHAMKS